MKPKNLYTAIIVLSVVFVVPAVSEAETYDFVLSWGSYGSGDGEFDYPYFIAVDSSDNVYVADSENNRVQKFDSSGTFLAKWGSYGSGDGEFKNLWGIAVDSSDNVYVADTSNHRIQKFDSDGNFSAKWGSQGSGDGQLYYPQAIAVDSFGNIYVGSGHRVQKFDSSGEFLAILCSYGIDGYPGGIAVDSSDNVYVADYYSNHRIQKFDSDGIFSAQWGSQGQGDGEFYYPYGIAVDSSGNIYVADSGNHRIQKFSTDSPTPETMLAGTALFIMGEVDVGNIDAELEGSLLAKVNAALAALDRGNPNDAKVAMNDLKALTNQVEAQIDKKITPAAAAEIIQRANDIIAELGG